MVKYFGNQNAFQVSGEDDEYDSADDWEDRQEFEDMMDEHVGMLVDGIEDYSRQHQCVLPKFYCVHAGCLLVLDGHGFLAKDQCAKCGLTGHWWKECPNEERRFKGKPKPGLKRKAFIPGPQRKPRASWISDAFEDEYPHIGNYMSSDDYDGYILFQKGKKGRRKGPFRKRTAKGKGAFLSEDDAFALFRRGK